jgi:phosphatidylinositol-bisphosphatase
MDEEDLFLESGDQEEMERIREALDTGTEFGKVDNPHSMAETLLTYAFGFVCTNSMHIMWRSFGKCDSSCRFLESLSEPVIPMEKYKQVLEASQSYAHARQVVSTLPEVHFNTFYYLMAFLRVILQREQKNKLTPEKLGISRTQHKERERERE